MTQIKIKRVYEHTDEDDGFRVLVDRLWPRGMSKEELIYDDWEKDITPSTHLREWFHEDEESRWDQFVSLYRVELQQSDALKEFAARIKKYPVVTLLYASKQPEHNHAKVLQKFLIEHLD